MESSKGRPWEYNWTPGKMAIQSIIEGYKTGIDNNTDHKKAPNTSIHNAYTGSRGKEGGYITIYNNYIYNHTIAIYKPEYTLEHV